MGDPKQSAAKIGNPAALFRLLPSVDELLRTPQLVSLAATNGKAPVTDAARTVLARLRQDVATGKLDETGLLMILETLPAQTEASLRTASAPSLRRVINATGVILHTNLGRAPLSAGALAFLTEIASGYNNLEFDLATGERGKRDVHLQHLFARLFKSQGWCPPSSLSSSTSPSLSTVIVNNNAAAVLLALNSLAEGAEVIVSRGELVEIGGSFRIPDVMAKSGAILREVGTTNRTRIADYERAITEKTRLLLRVHRSNFEITGFTEQPTLAELVELGQRRGIPLMEDLGSGALFDLPSAGIRGEQSVGDSIRAGVDVITYSGDKLLGGPQAGILTGRADLIARIRSNQMFRAFRADKLIYAAMEATLRSYVAEQYDAIPALAMMRLSVEQIGGRAERIQAALAGLTRLKVEVIPGQSVIGGGAAPGSALPTQLLAISSANSSANTLAAQLRASDIPIIARVEDDRLLLDLRTVFPEQDDIVLSALRQLASSKAKDGPA